MRFEAREGAVFMSKRTSYRFLIMGLRIALGMAMCVCVAKAQRPPLAFSEAQLYCSGLVTDQTVPNDTYLISGENSNYKTTFVPGDYVYINRGADHGVKAGDEFEVIRPERDRNRGKWFK